MVRQPVLDGCMFGRKQASDAGQRYCLLGTSFMQHASLLRCCRVSLPSASYWYLCTGLMELALSGWPEGLSDDYQHRCSCEYLQWYVRSNGFETAAGCVFSPLPPFSFLFLSFLSCCLSYILESLSLQNPPRMGILGVCVEGVVQGGFLGVSSEIHAIGQFALVCSLLKALFLLVSIWGHVTMLISLLKKRCRSLCPDFFVLLSVFSLLKSGKKAKPNSS